MLISVGLAQGKDENVEMGFSWGAEEALNVREKSGQRTQRLLGFVASSGPGVIHTVQL